MSRSVALLWCALLVLGGCEPAPTSQAHYRVIELLKNSNYDEALARVNGRLAKEPRKLVWLENRLLLLLASEHSRSHQAVLETQRQLDLVGAGRTLLIEQAESRLTRVRLQTAMVLGLLGDASGLGALKDLAEDTDQEVRAEAVHALGRLKQAAAGDLLQVRLRDGYWKVRAEAAHALAELGDPAATRQLFRAADDGDDYVRMQVRNAIVALAEPAQADLYRKQAKARDAATRIVAALALAKLRLAEAVPTLVELLEDRATPERLLLAEGLLAQRVDAALIRRLAKNERDPQIEAILREHLRQPARASGAAR